MSEERFEVHFASLTVWQLALVVEGAKSANVPVELDAQAIAAIRGINRDWRSVPRSELDARAIAKISPSAA